MAMSNAAQSHLLALLMQNATWAGVGDTTGIVGSTGAGSLYVSLHTADPTAAGTQTSSEATYTGYGRQAVARTSGAWSITGSSPTSVSNAAAVNFAQCTGSSNTITYFAIGKASGVGAGEIIVSGALSASLAVSNGVTPSFAIGALVATVD